MNTSPITTFFPPLGAYHRRQQQLSQFADTTTPTKARAGQRQLRLPYKQHQQQQKKKKKEETIGAPSPGQPTKKKKKKKTKRAPPAHCKHGKFKAHCKKGCGGSAFCKHGKRKTRCKEGCGGSAYCKHGKNKAYCKEGCGGSAYCKHGKTKVYCKEGCGGSAICKHGKEKKFCREGCGGSAFCKHGKQKAVCKKGCGGSSICNHGKHKQCCPECIPLEKLLASRRFCSICGVTQVKPRQRTVCAGCDATAKARTEHVVWEILEPLLHYPPSSRDNTMVGGRAGVSECAGVQTTGGSCGQRRPDASWVCHGHRRVVYLEIDEHSHRDRETSCELSKVDDTAFSQASTTDGTLLRGVFIRFNPDAYDERRVLLIDRVKHLAEVIKSECMRPTEMHGQITKPRVVYMYYHSNAYKHIHAARSQFDDVTQIP